MKDPKYSTMMNGNFYKLTSDGFVVPANPVAETSVVPMGCIKDDALIVPREELMFLVDQAFDDPEGYVAFIAMCPDDGVIAIIRSEDGFKPVLAKELLSGRLHLEVHDVVMQRDIIYHAIVR